MNGREAELPWQSVHFIGIGGVGMFGIALILLDLGVGVTGSDSVDSDNLEQLRARGVLAKVGHDAVNLGQVDAVVYSSAVPSDNPELRMARDRGLACYRRGRFLAVLAGCFETVVAVAGSHGKTTTTAMITHILKTVRRQPGYLVGGSVVGWHSPASAGAGRRLLITEVDESDATQADMRSHCAVVLNIEDDHCWSVGGEAALHQCFVRFAQAGTNLLAWSSPSTRQLLGDHPLPRFLSEADIPTGLTVPQPGHHNRINATVALAVAEQLGVKPAAAIAALKEFPGVQRRMSLRYQTPGGEFLIVEDYAHHPTELKATMQAVRQRWPQHHLTVIMQPHRFERVKRYAEQFRLLLEKADAAVVFRPFSAWVTDEEIADPAVITAGLDAVPSCYWDGNLSGLARKATELAAPAPEVGRIFLVVGAGDVNQAVAPLRHLLAGIWRERLKMRLMAVMPALHLEYSRRWSDLTTLGIGRARPLIAEPENTEQLTALLKWLKTNQIPFLILGGGSNLVGADSEQSVLVLRLVRKQFNEVKVSGNSVVCGAGVRLPRLVEKLLADGPIEPSFAALGWIPGSVGGAVRMNAGCDQARIGDFVTSIEGVSDAGERFHRSGRHLKWSYRQVNLPENDIVTRVRLRFATSSLQAAGEQYRESGDRRHSSQPPGRSAGCVFRNPGELSAGKLIERCGLKGERVGDCQVNRRHANFIVNLGNGGEAEFLALAKHAIRRVYRRTGIRLRPEVRFAAPVAAEEIAQAIPPHRLAVLAGGPSSERSISLDSGKAVAEALRQAGHHVRMIDLEKSCLPNIPSDVEVVFPVLHGAFGEDGQVQALLKRRKIPYVGSGPAASRLMIDKAATKQALRNAGIPTPPWWVLTESTAALPADAVPPLVVKPEGEGSSVGVGLVEDLGRSWQKARGKAFKYSHRVLVEKYISGVEITVGVVFGRPLPVIEIIPPPGRWFDYDAKYLYKHGKTRYLCPPRSITEAVQEHARELAALAWRQLGAKDMARFDFIVDRDGIPWCLEVNSIPGFTATSLLPKAAKAAGIGFVELCASLAMANLPGWTGETQATNGMLSLSDRRDGNRSRKKD